MSSPRFRPRDFTLEPDGFGKVAAIAWDDTRQGSRLRAAQLQHTYATEIRRLAKSHFGSIRAYALAVGQSEDRLAKMLRGDAIMRIEDLADAQIFLDWTIPETDTTHTAEP